MKLNESKDRIQFLMKCEALLIGFLATARIKLFNMSAESDANMSVIPKMLIRVGLIQM